MVSVSLRPRFVGLLGLLLPLSLAGCNDTSTITTGAPANLVITVTPDPIISTNSLNPTIADYDAQWTVTITETAGVGGNLMFVTANLYDPNTGAQGGHTSLDASDLLVLAGESHLPPKGTLKVQQSLSYRLPSRGKSALLSVEVEMKDDSGNLLDPAVLVQVQ
jgi:hypothetical protein